MTEDAGVVDTTGEGLQATDTPPVDDSTPKTEPAPQTEPDTATTQTTEPETQEITLPEGLNAEDPFVAAFKGVVESKGWGQEGMDAMAELYGTLSEKAAQAAEADEKAFAEKSEQALRDEWGGDFDANVKAANRGLKKVIGDNKEFTDMLNETGLGDHPEMVRLFLKIDQVLGEDSFETGRTAATPSGPRRTEGGTPILHFPSMEGG